MTKNRLHDNINAKLTFTQAITARYTTSYTRSSRVNTTFNQQSPQNAAFNQIGSTCSRRLTLARPQSTTPSEVGGAQLVKSRGTWARDVGAAPNRQTQAVHGAAE